MLDSTPIDAAFVGVGEKKLKEESFSSRKKSLQARISGLSCLSHLLFFCYFSPTAE